MIAVTGANGHLGQLVIEGLVERVPANQIIAAVRSPEKASSFGTLGVQVREADYTRPETLTKHRASWCEEGPAHFGSRSRSEIQAAQSSD
jgi:nucleoside-diphosphate-sugar epimerase